MEENLVKKFIGEKAEVMYEKIQKKGSFNIFAALFTVFYFLYRKMYLAALLVFIAQGIVVDAKNGYITIAFMILIGFLFYPIYKIHIDGKINKIKEQTSNEEEIEKMCTEKGGTSIAALLVLLIPVILLVVILAIGIALYSYNVGMTVIH